MFVLQMVGSVLGKKADEKLLGGFLGRNIERVEKGMFYIRLARAVLIVKKAHAAEIANEIVEAVKAEVPVREGHLRDSVRFVGNSKGGRIVAGGTPETMKKFRDGAATFDQALGIEYGTTKNPAHPFFWSVLRRYEKKLEKRLGTKLEQEFGD